MRTERSLLVIIGIVLLLIGGYGIFSTLTKGNPLRLYDLEPQLNANVNSVVVSLNQAGMSAKNAGLSIRSGAQSIQQGVSAVQRSRNFMYSIGKAININILGQQPFQQPAAWFALYADEMEGLQGNLQSTGDKLSGNAQDMEQLSENLYDTALEFRNTGDTLVEFMHRIDQSTRYTMILFNALFVLLGLLCIAVGTKKK